MVGGEKVFAILFPIAWLGMWIIITTLLTWASGWRDLAATYHDADGESPTLRMFFQSGSMKGRASPFPMPVNFKNCLGFSVHPSGLRMGLLWIFRPFTRNFLVPWRDLRVERNRGFFGESIKIQIGEIASLKISGRLGDRLAAAAAGQWPEPRPIGSGGNIVT